MGFRIKNEGKPLGNLTNLDVVRVRGNTDYQVQSDRYAKDIKDIIEGIKLSELILFKVFSILIIGVLKLIMTGFGILQQ